MLIAKASHIQENGRLVSPSDRAAAQSQARHLQENLSLLIAAGGFRPADALARKFAIFLCRHGKLLLCSTRPFSDFRNSGK